MTQHLEAALNSSAHSAAAPGEDHDLLALLCEAAAQQRDPAAIRKYAPLAERSAMDIEHRLHLGIAHRAWAVAHTLAGEFAQASARLQRALDIFAAYPAPWQIGRTQFELGELARAQGLTTQARDHYSSALSAFEALRAAAFAARTRSALESLTQA